MADKIRLSQDDWGLLFPDKKYKLANVDLTIRPLTLTQLATFKAKMEEAGPKIEARGVTRDNYNTTENIIFIAGLVVDIMPELLSEVTGIHEDDIKQLPLNALVELLTFVIEMNLECKDGLEKNFKTLGQTMEGILFGGTSEIPSKSSSSQDTPGTKSKVTPKVK